MTESLTLAPGPGIAHVAVPLPIPGPLSYAVPPELADQLAPGHRVRVTVQGRVRIGVVIALGGSPVGRLQPILGVLDPAPAVPGPLLDVTRRVAEETLGTWGEVLGRALPPAARFLGPPVSPAPAPAGPRGPLVLACGADREDRAVDVVVRARTRGEGVLVIVPEIDLARRWQGRLERGLGEPVACLTSADGPRQRWAAWWGARTGQVPVVVGTRAAVFVPLRAPGLMVLVDEDHQAHKAPDGPRWHARDVLLRRARAEGAACLFLSGAPSLESWVRARSGAMTLDGRPGDPWPPVHTVDLRRAPEAQGLTPELGEAVREGLSRGQSALLVLNRLGFARALTCLECGSARRCHTCRVALTYHRRARALSCRLCGWRGPAASLCGRCRGRRLAAVGWGTERLEALVRERFGAAGVARYDGEVSRPEAEAVRQAFRARRVRIIVGTHMALRLLGEAPVGVAALVQADATLAQPDFRAGERTFRLGWLLAEGVGAAGSVWLQSFLPDHPALAAVKAGDRERFYEIEWADRQALGYPPARRLARVTAAGSTAVAAVGELAGRARSQGLDALGPTVLGGARVQLLLLGGEALPEVLRELVGPLRRRRPRGTSWLTVDMDPLDLT